MKRAAKIILALLVAGWFIGISAFYWSIYPLRLATHFSGFLQQFDGYEGFNLSYIGDVLFLVISLWFAMLIGYFITQLLKVRFDSLLELLVISTGLGLFALGMLVFFVGVFGKLYGFVFQLLYLICAPLLALFIAGTHYKDEFLRHTVRASGILSSRFSRLFCTILITVIAVLLIIGFLYTLTPPTQSDGLRYHLSAPQEYIKYHRILYIPFNAFSNFPFLIEMLFTLGLLLWSDILAKLFHFSLLVLSGVLLILFWRHLFQPELREILFSGSSSGNEQNKTHILHLIPGDWLSALIFFTTPAVFIVGCWEFIDLAVTYFFIAMIYAITRWLKSRERNWLIIASFFAAASLGTKYTMVFFIFVAGLWIILFHLLSQRNVVSISTKIRTIINSLVLFGLIAAVLGSPWYLKNLINTGNPVYPFAYNVFDGGEWSEANTRFYKAKAGEKGLPRSLKTFITVPWDTAIYWSEFEAFNPGCIYLLFFPLGVVLAGLLFFLSPTEKHPGIKTIIFFAGWYYLLWYFTYQSNRFMIPLYALSALIIVAVVVKLWHFWKPLSWLAICVLVVSCLYGSLWSVRWVLTETQPHPLPVVLGFESRDHYLRKALNYYPCAQWLNLKVRNSSKVLFIGEHRGYYFSNVEFLTSDWYDTPYIIHLIRHTKNNDELFDWLKQNNVHYVLMNFAELSLYYEEYFKPRFTNEEIRRFEEFIHSDRLQRVFPPGDSRTFICKIK